jgi:hypothetical protein
MSWLVDFESFDPTSLSAWASLVNFIPRFPYVYTCDCVLCCFLVRESTKIPNPLFSFILALVMATLSDNFDAVLRNRKLATFEKPLLVPIFAAVWLLFNFSPLDLAFKVARFLAVPIALVGGFLAARDLTAVTDLAITMYPTTWIRVILIASAAGAGRHMLLHTYAQIFKQPARSSGPIIFGAAVGALAYYWLTDYGHISMRFWFDREQTRLGVLVAMALFGGVHWVVGDKPFAVAWAAAGKILGWIIPYYGATWVPSEAPPQAPRPVPAPVPGEKVKTD